MRSYSQTRWRTMCHVSICTVCVATVYFPQISNARVPLWFVDHKTEIWTSGGLPKKPAWDTTTVAEEYNNNGGTSRVSTGVALRGRFSAQLDQPNMAMTPDVGARLFHWCDSIHQAIGTGLYYSA